MIFRILTFLCLFAATLPAQDIPEIWDVTIEVNQHDPRAKDDDPTTPFKTINAAAQNALGFARAGRTVLVRIQPGVYRENVRLIGKTDENYAMIKLEGTDPGKVILNGCELVGGWKVNDDNQFERAWTREKEKIASAQAGPVMVNPTVFIEGARMVEVDSRSKVKPGKVFFGDGKVYLIPPKGGVVSDTTVEITRPFENGIYVENIDSIFIESLSVERGFKNGIEVYGLNEENAEPNFEFKGFDCTVIINNVSVEYVRCTGIEIWHSKTLRMRRVFVERCGWSGIGVMRVEESTVTGTAANLNGWAVDYNVHEMYRETGGGAGMGFMGCLNIKVWSLRAAENHGIGFSAYKIGGNASFGKVTAVNNLQLGVFIDPQRDAFSDRAFPQAEIEPGQVMLSESDIAFNEVGLFIGDDVTAIVNVIYGNSKSQAVIGGAVLTQNIIVAEAGQALVVNFEKAEFTASQNLYYSSTKKAFLLGKSEKLDDALTFAQWQEQTGQDLNSYFGDPKLLDPKNYSFTPTPESPWFKMKQWPVRELN